MLRSATSVTSRYHVVPLLLAFVLPRLQYYSKHLQHQTVTTRPLLSSKMSVQYPVFLTRFHLGMQDPHGYGSGPRYHTTIFVASEADGSGILHQVTGDISSPRAMYYYPSLMDPPEHSETAPSGLWRRRFRHSNQPGLFVILMDLFRWTEIGMGLPCYSRGHERAYAVR